MAVSCHYTVSIKEIWVSLINIKRTIRLIKYFLVLKHFLQDNDYYNFRLWDKTKLLPRYVILFYIELTNFRSQFSHFKHLSWKFLSKTCEKWEVNAIINIYHYHIISFYNFLILTEKKRFVLKIRLYLWHPQEKILLFILQTLFETRSMWWLLFYSPIYFQIIFCAFTFFSFSTSTKYIPSLTNILFSFL